MTAHRLLSVLFLTGFLTQACTVKECLGPDPHPECPRAQRFAHWDTGWDTGRAERADPVIAVWSLEDGQFSDGARLDGYIVFDHANDALIDYALCAASTPEDGLLPPGGEPWSAFEYRSTTSRDPKRPSLGLSFESYALFGPYSNSTRMLRLGEPPDRGPLENAGVTRPVADGALECVNCAPSRHVLDGRWSLKPKVADVDRPPCQ